MLYESLNTKTNMETEQIQLSVTNGNQIRTKGYALLKCQVDNRVYYLKFCIFDGRLRQMLLGRIIWPNWRNTFENVEINRIQNVSSPELIESYKNNILTQYADVFNNIQQPVLDYQVHISIDPQAIQVFRKFYRIPYSLVKK